MCPKIDYDFQVTELNWVFYNANDWRGRHSPSKTCELTVLDMENDRADRLPGNASKVLRNSIPYLQSQS